VQVFFFLSFFLFLKNQAEKRRKKKKKKRMLEHFNAKRFKGAQRPWVTSFPNALLNLTFAFLDLHDLANARCVCKLFSKAQAARARLIVPLDIRNEACMKLLRACEKGHVENLAVASARVGDDVVAWASSCKNLKKLTLCEAVVTALTPLTRCAHLSHLTLVCVRSLTSLHTLSNASLTDLTLERCQLLTEVGEVGEVWTSPNLKRLTIANCEALEAIKHFNARLTEIHAQGCIGLRDIRGVRSMHNLNSLQVLNLNGCTALSDVWPLYGLSELRSLSMVDCFNVDDFAWLEKCTQLRSLNLEGCSVGVLPALSPELTKLEINFCVRLTSIESLKGCTRLKKLYARNCSVPLDGLAPNLQELYASDHATVNDTACCAHLHALRVLDLHGCPMLDNLCGLHGCKKLAIVDLSDCPSLEILCGLNSCVKLEMLSLQRCASVKYISALASCAALETLDLTGCEIAAGEAQHVLHVDNVFWE